MLISKIVLLSAFACSFIGILAVVAADEPPVPIDAESHAAVRSLEAELAKGVVWGEPLAAQTLRGRH